MNEIRAIELIGAESSKNKKIELLQEFKSDKLGTLLKLAFDPFIVFGLKKVVYNKSNTKLYQDFLHDEFITLANFCASSNTDANKRDTVTTFLNKCTQPQQDIYASILIKKLRIGATISSCNKAYGKDFITDFKIMLADTVPDLNLDTKKLVQEKYDGVRAVIFKENGVCKAFTRQGKSLYLENIFKALEKSSWDNFMLDGELIGGNRTETTSITSRLLKGNLEVTDIDLTFNAFDLVSVNEFKNRNNTTPLYQRLIDLESMLMSTNSSQIMFGKSWITSRKDEVLSIYKEVVAKGGEGLVVKDLDAYYYFKRSKAWAKLKEINYCTLKITDVIEGTGKDAGRLGAITCVSSCGKIKTNVGSGFSDELRTNMWKARDNIIGNFVEIKFNELQKSREGKYYLFLPVFIETRVDKTEADDLVKISKECGV